MGFLAITLVYQRACYDRAAVSDEDCKALESFCNVFFRNARGQAGLFKWIFWRFWRI